MLVNNFLWLPEAMILFWIVAALRKRSEEEDPPPASRKYLGEAAGILLLISFVIFNILHFQTLHPLNLTSIKGTTYHYGLWYSERDNRGLFNWTKKSSGIYLTRKAARDFVISCQAPLHHLSPAKSQEVGMFWQGKLVEKIVFTATGDKKFKLKDNGDGFLEFRVWPTFNLKEMGLGVEGRTLGVQLFRPAKEER